MYTRQYFIFRYEITEGSGNIAFEETADLISDTSGANDTENRRRAYAERR